MFVVALLLILLFLFKIELSFFEDERITSLIVFVAHIFVVSDSRFCAISDVLRVNLTILEVLGEHFLVNFRLCLVLCLFNYGFDAEALVWVVGAEVVIKATDHGFSTFLSYKNSKYSVSFERYNYFIYLPLMYYFVSSSDFTSPRLIFGSFDATYCYSSEDF